MSQTQQSGSPPNGAGSDVDPLASLHKMSTTAGLGSTDYVEVNPTAIAAVVLGVASAVTLFNERLLLLVPAAGIVTAILAFRQISRSNGTQTGRLLAVLAIVLSLAFGGIVFGRDLIERHREAQNKAAIGAVVMDFDKHLKAGEFDAAYQLFDDRFRQRVAATHFADTMKFVTTSEMYGKLWGVTLPGMPANPPPGYRWDGLAEFMVDEANGGNIATAHMAWNFEKAGEVRQQAWFRIIDGNWMLEDIPGMFPRQKKPGEPDMPG